MKLAVTEAGQGPPVAFLHGLLGAGQNFGAVQKALAARGRRVLALDLRNHGASPHAPSMSYPEMAADVAETLQAEPVSALYAHGRRHVCEVRPTEPQSTASHLRRGGTYLITGGFGHVGLVFARHLAAKFRANLILVGRSLLDEGRRQILETLSSLGGQAMYVAADVTDEGSMTSVVQEALARFGAIHGVVHGAGLAGGQAATAVDDQGVLEELHVDVLLVDAGEIDEDLEAIVRLAHVGVRPPVRRAEHQRQDLRAPRRRERPRPPVRDRRVAVGHAAIAHCPVLRCLLFSP